MTELSKGAIWDNIYGKQEQLSIWPWSDLVSIVMRFARPTEKNFTVFELGCGAGANIPFFLSLGVNYYSVESSDIIVSKLHETYPQYRDSIAVGDFTSEIPDVDFDLIVDRGSLSNNGTKSIEVCLDRCYEKLKPGGKFICVDWYSTMCSAFHLSEAEDEWTRVNFSSGPFVDAYRMHFADKQRMLNLFHKFEIRLLEHKVVENKLDSEHPIVATWNIVAVKN